MPGTHLFFVLVSITDRIYFCVVSICPTAEFVAPPHTMIPYKLLQQAVEECQLTGKML